jgi:hypothetical protein
MRSSGSQSDCVTRCLGNGDDRRLLDPDHEYAHGWDGTVYSGECCENL